MTEWKVPVGYTGGEVVLYWDGQELIEMRMVDDDLQTAARAAATLKSRFFFRKVGHDHARDLPIWGAYDSQNYSFARGVTSYPGTRNRGNADKLFTTDDTAPLIMWAAAKGGR